MTEKLQERLPAISKNMPITIHAGLLIALLCLVWFLSDKVNKWEARLDKLETRSSDRWSALMEEEAWRDFMRDPTKAPNVARIKEKYSVYFR